MITQLKKWLAINPAEKESTISDEELLQRAAAALLFEIATVDQNEDPQELIKIKHHIAEQFSLSEKDLESVLKNAKAEHTEATSLYQFTRLINDHMSHAEKCQLIESMWSVAFADGVLDKYEEYMIRRVADLIHLAHGDFIRAKLKVKQSNTI